MMKKKDIVLEEDTNKQEEYIIQHSISKCLRLMTALDLTSMALPCIGAGYAGFGLERVGRVMSANQNGGILPDLLQKVNILDVSHITSPVDKAKAIVDELIAFDLRNNKLKAVI